MEHFDFSLLQSGYGEEFLRETVSRELGRMKKEKALPEEQFALLEEKKLAEVLSNPVFSELSGMRLYREQQFLVSLPVGEMSLEAPAACGTCAEETVLFQGAIDLLAVADTGEVRIIDYKYSGKSAAALREHYASQLSLYKKAVSRIMRLEPSRIRCSIVNIRLGFETDVE
ncbi:MAG: PD-(D/E)XK nuclease family protein [Christensenellaceae bacterium]